MEFIFKKQLYNFQLIFFLLMKDQVTTIEQSQRLLQLGIPSSKASMVWTECSGDYHLAVLPHYRASLACIEDGVSVPAFTVVDLLNLFKTVKGLQDFGPCLERTTDHGDWDFEFGPITEDEDYGYAHSSSLVDLLVGRIEWVLSHDYELQL